MEERWYDTYNESWRIYDRFSECEDFEDSAFTALLKHICFDGKTVYEYGCGTGKYTKKISELCNELYANDISPFMIERAQERCANRSNIKYITNSAENSGLADESVDIIFGAWAGPPIWEKEIISKIEKEFSRILKKDGSIWLFANYLKGEFTQMRKLDEPLEPAAYFLNELGMYGYTLVEVVPAYWNFSNLEEAKQVCNFIFGDNATAFFDKKGCPIMEDNIGIFSRTK